MSLNKDDLADKLIDEGFMTINIDKLDKDSILAAEVFTHIFLIKNQLDRTTLIVNLQEKARQLGVTRAFDKMLKAHQTEYAQKFKQAGSNIIQFTNPPINDLKCGKWECNDSGVTKTILGAGMIPQSIVACPHPILPVERLVNVDTETEKIKLSFFKDNQWQSITVDRSTVANKSHIVALSDRGIEVNSENSKDLVNYIADIVSLNMQEIPVNKSINRLGWIEGEFAPYVDNLKYDGDIAYKDIYESIKERGDYEQWKQLCIDIRKKSKTAHLLLAASFSSPLVSPLGVLPFVFHIWGGTGAGKTVGLMLAMSIWGNPEIGKLVRSLNATQVALARMASFLHNIPFAGDELQTIKNRWDNFDNLVMFLTEGLDRGRGKAYGGLEELREWSCCFLFTGEEPITKSASGGGVKNRVIEVECTEKVIEDGNYVSNFLRKNFGFAGKEFIKELPEQDKLQERYREIFKEILSKCDTTDKQAMAMAAILLADELATNIIFKDNNAFKIEDIKPYLASVSDVDVAKRAYEWICNWVAKNRNRFSNDSNGEIWGRFDETTNTCYINKDVLSEHLKQSGFDYFAIIGKLAERNQIERNTQGKFVHCTHVFGIKGSYIKLNMQVETFEEVDISKDELPF